MINKEKDILESDPERDVWQLYLFPRHADVDKIYLSEDPDEIMEKYGGRYGSGKKQSTAAPEGTAVLCFFRLLLLRSTDRTCICTCAALEASICVDDVLAVALSDRADRTCICTCTALDACITDSVCHNCYLL